MAKLFGGMPQAARALLLRKHLPAPGHEDAAAGAAFQNAVADQVLISAGDGVGIDEENFSQQPDGRQLFADGQLPGGDGLMNLLDDLPKNRGIAGGRDGEPQRHGCISTIIHKAKPSLIFAADIFRQTAQASQGAAAGSR